MRTSLKLARLVLASTLASLPFVNACAGSAEEVVDGAVAASAPESCSVADCPVQAGPDDVLSYEELLELQSLRGIWKDGKYEVFGGNEQLAAKVNRLLTTPFINNEAFHAGRSIPKAKPTVPELGSVPTLRTVAWNIERGENLAGIKEMLKASATREGRAAYVERIRHERALDEKQVRELRADIDAIAQTDVFILNEVDRGMARSDMKDVVKELASELSMNWTWGLEFIEVDSLSLGNETFGKDDFKAYDTASGALVADIAETELSELESEARTQMNEVAEAMRAEPGLKALHGNAILSRYPIKKNVRLKRFDTRVGARRPPDVDGTWKKAECWDWSNDERQKANLFVDALIDEGQTLVAEKIFMEKIERQIRHGGRTVMLADVVVNGLDGKDVTVVNAHLESKATPKCRMNQMKEVLAEVDNVTNPVIFGGDLNTSGSNGMPMTLSRLLFERFKKPEYWIRQISTRALRDAIPWVGWAWQAWDIVKFIKKQDDPTSIFHPEHDLFGEVKKHGFDFRGEKLRTIKTDAKPEGTKGTLANSNQRDQKGFKTSFSFRAFGPIGKMKLDWIFVRPFTPGEKKAYRFAPHFARTLEALDNAPTRRLSDHYPLVVTLPLTEPCLGVKNGTLPPEVDETRPDNYDVSYTSPDVVPPAEGPYAW
jgi:endonuclease/exonuclease/phosphatase family metal-dependent hydrolase